MTSGPALIAHRLPQHGPARDRSERATLPPSSDSCRRSCQSWWQGVTRTSVRERYGSGPKRISGLPRSHCEARRVRTVCAACRAERVRGFMVRWFVVRVCGPAWLAQQQHPSYAASINEHTELSTTDGTFGPYERRLLAPKTQDSIYLFTAMLRASSGRRSEYQVLSCPLASGQLRLVTKARRRPSLRKTGDLDRNRGRQANRRS